MLYPTLSYACCILHSVIISSWSFILTLSFEYCLNLATLPCSCFLTQLLLGLLLSRFNHSFSLSLLFRVIFLTFTHFSEDSLPQLSLRLSCLVTRSVCYLIISFAFTHSPVWGLTLSVTFRFFFCTHSTVCLLTKSVICLCYLNLSDKVHSLTYLVTHRFLITVVVLTISSTNPCSIVNRYLLLFHFDEQKFDQSHAHLITSLTFSSFELILSNCLVQPTLLTY